jgi:hypothetical protein
VKREKLNAAPYKDPTFTLVPVRHEDARAPRAFLSALSALALKVNTCRWV